MRKYPRGSNKNIHVFQILDVSSSKTVAPIAAGHGHKIVWRCRIVDSKLCASKNSPTATAGSDVVQSGRPIFDDFSQHLWPYIGNNTANVVFQMVKHLWLIRIDQ
ncbi:hypothetical protein TNCV_4162481 [Trichonephila clavipes]|nr:hypothetical protein TNCV_4162481 [Trichonephila clavipes]